MSLRFLFAVVVVVALSSAAAEALGHASASSSPVLEAQFSAWMQTHNKKYDSEVERQWRMEVFSQNMDKIDALNAKYFPKTKFGINKFADMPVDEFKESWAGGHGTVTPELKRSLQNQVAPLYSAAQVNAIPGSWDWRTKGAVTGVKNQGQCGSCWSFSTTGNVEGQWFLKKGTLVGLSEQNLVDCDHHCMTYEGQQACDAGCDGGLMPNAFMYIMGNNGIDTEATYPYTAMDGTCSFNSANVGAKLTNYTMISSDETQMAAWLYNNGPIAIAADAQEWQFYIEGVFYLPCGDSLDHGILIVGYGTETDIFDQTMPFWIVKNSWGADWGESGYIRIERGNAECGLNQFPCSGIV